MVHQENKKLSPALLIFLKGKKHFLVKQRPPLLLITPKAEVSIKFCRLSRPMPGRRIICLFFFFFPILFAVSQGFIVCTPKAHEPFLVILRIRHSEFSAVRIPNQRLILHRFHAQNAKSFFYPHKSNHAFLVIVSCLYFIALEAVCHLFPAFLFCQNRPFHDPWIPYPKA